jgi:hypothetical protein
MQTEGAITQSTPTDVAGLTVGHWAYALAAVGLARLSAVRKLSAGKKAL